MNIWCEFEVDQLKTLLYRVHTRNDKVGPLVVTMSPMRGDNVQDLDHGPMNIWHEFEKDPLKLRDVELTQEKPKNFYDPGDLQKQGQGQTYNICLSHWL